MSEVKLIKKDGRRIFYVEVGDLPKHKIQEVVDKFRVAKKEK